MLHKILDKKRLCLAKVIKGQDRLYKFMQPKIYQILSSKITNQAMFHRLRQDFILPDVEAFLLYNRSHRDYGISEVL